VLLPVATPDVGLVSRHLSRWPRSLAVAPVPQFDLWEKVADKLTFTRLIESLGREAPRTLELTPGLSREAIETTLPYPFLAKPRRRSGGDGILLIKSELELDALLSRQPDDYLLQEVVAGEDVALTLLCEQGEAFGVLLRRRWFLRNTEASFAPMRDVEFFHCDWLEEIGRRLVAETRFSGVADFDLRVDFAAQRALFLECDPRLMGGMRSCATFGVNVPGLLCRRALGERFPLVRNQPGRFLSLTSLWPWLRSGGWRRPSHSGLKTGLREALADPVPLLARRCGLVKG
jgi:predicted ATP-grasp superfamily ATP-dependent carboligase